MKKSIVKIKKIILENFKNVINGVINFGSNVNSLDIAKKVI